MASSIRLSNLFQSVANSDYPYIHSQYSINSGNRARTLVLPENVDETELYQFNIFLSAIEIKPTDINNMGFAFYSNDVFNYHSPCYLGLRDGQLGLLIGATTDRFGIETQDLFIPCEIDQVEKKRGKKTVTEFEYTINGTPIELVEQIDNEGKGTGKFYINLEYYAEDLLKTINFSFPFLVDKKANYQPSDIIKFWRSGKFADVCRDVDQRNSRLWIECNKAFVPSFQSNSFPRGGVLLLVKSGAIKITPAGTYENIKSDIVQSSWEIIASSHPELIINWKNSNKEYEYITLADATDIQFTSAMVKNEGYTWLVNNTCLGNQIMLIHIVGPSAIKITNSPVNTVTALEPRILAKIAAFPHLQEIYRASKDKMQSNKQLPASAEQTIREATKEDYEDVNGVYPVLAGSGLEDF